MNFEPIIDAILRAEQGYVDHPNDRGGPTNHGITLAVARANGYDGDMREMPVSLAREIYRRRYIVAPAFDKVAILNADIATELIDTGVNMGPARAAEMLQRLLNGLNAQGSRYPDLFVDGRIGKVTLDALAAFLRWRGLDGVKVILRGLNSQQAMRYLDIAENNPSQESFLYGWLLHRVN